jgi:lysine-N-methylase
VADRCRHNCCIGWEIDVDEDTLEKYRALSGEVGARIRASLTESEGCTCFCLGDGERCVHLDEQGLCRIIRELGEESLCEICREHPRFYHWIGERREGGLGAACEEAARLILDEADYASLVQANGEEVTITPETGKDFDAFAWRVALYGVLSDAALPYEERRRLVRARYALPTRLEGEALTALLAELEYLSEDHRALLAEAALRKAEPPAVAAERFLAYLVYRHASPAEDEADFRLSVSLALQIERLFCGMTASLGLSSVEAARILSEELEYSEENTAAIRQALLEAELQGTSNVTPAESGTT